MNQTEELFSIPKPIISEGHLILLPIDGNSGAVSGVVDGDWVVVRDDITTADVGPGDIVAVMSDGDAALRNYPDWDSDGETLIGKAVTVLHAL